MGVPEIDIAIRAFEENTIHTHHEDLYHYNLAVGLLAMARVVKEMQDVLCATKTRVNTIESAVRKPTDSES